MDKLEMGIRMHRILTIAALVALAQGAPAVALADSHIYNATDRAVASFWSAQGCAKSAASCGDGWALNGICKKKHLSSGQSGSYHYPDTTWAREFYVVDCETGWDSSDRTGNKGSKKRCAVIYETIDGEKIATANCGYSSEEYEAIKAGSNRAAVNGPVFEKFGGVGRK